MLRYSACLNTLFTHEPWPERVAVVAATGLRAVEWWGMDPVEVASLHAAAREHGLALAAGSVDIPAGDPGARSLCRTRVEAATRCAAEHGVAHLIVRVGRRRRDRPMAEQLENARHVLQEAAVPAEQAGVHLHVEPSNSPDEPDYLLHRTDVAAALVAGVGAPGVDLCFDVYHVEREEGDAAGRLKPVACHVGYIHLSDIPGRRVPGRGTIPWPTVLAAIGATGYSGFVELECVPRGGEGPAAALREAGAYLAALEAAVGPAGAAPA